ncbi:MAG: PAS domain S-box protein [Myxococcota bacterium]
MHNVRRVLVVGQDGQVSQRVTELLSGFGVEALRASSDADAEALIATAPVSLVLFDYDRDTGLGSLHRLKAHTALTDVPVVVLLSSRTENTINRALEAGADDFLGKPLRETEFRVRVLAYLHLRESVEALAQKEHDAQVMLEVTRALSSSLDFREILFTVVRRIADVVNVSRVSIVLAPEPEQGDVGYVVVASDDEELSNLRIDLSKYPEIQQVLRTRERLTITDVATHPLLDAVRADVKRSQIESMTLLPIVWQDQALGVLFLRGQSRGGLSERETGFCHIVANATAVALRNAKVMQSLRDHTQQITFARFEAERRLRSLKRYADLFDSLSDGIAVMDADGYLLFANPRAFAILGHDEESVSGKKVRQLIHEDDQARARALWDGFPEGRFPKDVDLRLIHRDGRVRIANVSTASLMHSEGAVLISFRDVTENRRIEKELVRTKEFLESLIEASIDGIVAADMKGNIMLFNGGAERIYGYQAEEVLGKVNVRSLYPEGIAENVMAMIRSPQHGGRNLLESTRLDALTKEGERVPISLSAALILQEGTPVASFGIFIDLREKIRVEERLAQAQQKLAVTEKQALIAELAGTAAHELNQPLTSVMGYAELLKRKLSDNTAEHHAADIIVRESERMAEIVRKIGKITKYETKSYVGQTRILDLDKATANEDSKPPLGKS